jgi:hypothetical protein
MANDAGADNRKQFLAVVSENADGSTITKKVVKTPKTKKELKVRIVAQKVALKEMREKYKTTQKEEADTCSRAFKRPPWEEADSLDVQLGDETRALEAVVLSDSWAEVKERACELFDVPDADYDMTINFQMPKDVAVRKVMRAAKVGELNVWNSSLYLKAKTAASSSSLGDVM